MRMHRDAVIDKMAAVLKVKLKSELENWLPLETFISMPSQAQVACASYFAAGLWRNSLNFRQALLNLDFTRAAKESGLPVPLGPEQGP
jgi:hypothetical protein